MRWHAGLSTAASLEQALGELASVAADAVPRPDLAFVFASPQHEPLEALPALCAEHWPDALVVGCTGGGLLAAGQEAEGQRALSVTLASLPDVQLHPFHLGQRELATAMASPLFLQQHLGLESANPDFLLFADPFSSPVEPALRAFDICFPGRTVVGGLASGGTRPGQHALFVGDRIERSGTAGLALTGAVSVRAAVAQGCRPVGPTLAVTASQGTTLHELDGQPALVALQQLFESLPLEERQLMQHSLFLGVLADDSVVAPQAGDFLIRNLVSLDPEDGTIEVAAQLTPGQRVRFHLRDAAASRQDVRAVLSRHGDLGRPAGALLFSCLGRGRGLYGEPDVDSSEFLSAFPDAALGGFFGNGELGPVGGSTWLHGYTASFALFSRS